MKFRALLTGLAVVLMIALLMTPISDARAQDDTPPDPTPASVEVVNDYYSVLTTTLSDGTGLTAQWINGPSEPPDPIAMEASRVAISSLDRAATLLPNFPSYDWVYGCSAVSGAMIAGYYDNQGYPNMYTGLTNGGVMPQTDTSWDTWSDGFSLYPNNPLVASHSGVDGLSEYENGSIDDYWVSANSGGPEPWEGGSQHTWETAIGDFMKTSQYSYPYRNVDGSTRFWTFNDGAKLSCSQMEYLMTYNPDFPEDPNYYIYRVDGTYGRKEFYEARGYTVTDCFNQRTDNNTGGQGGYSLVDFQSEINAGHPVLLNLEGHTVVGFGYDGSRIYIRDTWDNNPEHVYYMEWGMYYPLTDVIEDRMYMQSVSIVHLDDAPGFSKTSPANTATWVNPDAVTLAWEESTGALSYDYCIDVDTSCTSWVNTGTSTSVALDPLLGPQTYYWQVRANNSAGSTYANGAEGALWSFTTYDPSIMTEKNFLPLLTR
jgi:hypothetical protein